jgi:hypothetical protein
MYAGRHFRVAAQEQTNFKAASERVRCWRCAGRGTGATSVSGLQLLDATSVSGLKLLDAQAEARVCLFVSVFVCVSVFLSLARARARAL